MKTFPVDPITRTRRNHAFEHASMQLLARRAPGVRMAGYSTPGGFFIIGQVHISDVQEAVNEALARLQKGESGLAIHPYCGTNFVVSGIAAGLAAWLAMLGGENTLRERAGRLPVVAAAATLALMLTFPLGPRLQARVTTDAHLGGAQVARVDRFVRGPLVVHRIAVRYPAAENEETRL
jgi:hypothetical protein